MSTGAVDGPQDDLGADSVGIFVEAVGAAASVDLSIEDSVEGTDSTASLVGELARSTRKGAHTAAAEGISSSADAFSVRDDLVVAAGVAVALAIKELVGLALAYAGGSLEGLAGRTGASLVAVVDQIAWAD